MYNDEHADRNILAGVLGTELNSFVIPDAAALLEFLEVFEHHGVTGLIVLQTSTTQVSSQLLHYGIMYMTSSQRHVQTTPPSPFSPALQLRSKFGGRGYRRLLQAIQIADKNSTVFANEHHIECFSERCQSETVAGWQQRLLWCCYRNGSGFMDRLCWCTFDMCRLTITAALWYHNHLKELSGEWVEIVLLTEHKEVV